MGEQSAEEDVRVWREEVTGDWTRMHNEQFHHFFMSKNTPGYQIKEDTGGACGMYGREE